MGFGDLNFRLVILRRPYLPIPACRPACSQWSMGPFELAFVSQPRVMYERTERPIREGRDTEFAEDDRSNTNLCHLLRGKISTKPNRSRGRYGTCGAAALIDLRETEASGGGVRAGKGGGFLRIDRIGGHRGFRRGISSRVRGVGLPAAITKETKAIF